jgi:hypothetical protein
LDLFIPRSVDNALDMSALGAGTALLRDSDDVKRILIQIADSEAYRAERENVRKYKLHLQKTFVNFETTISEFTSQIADWPKTEFTVLLLPQWVRTGSYLRPGVIEWGFPDYYAGYQAVGIVHEVLHAVVDRLMRLSDGRHKYLLHALIYLTADEGLRSRIVHNYRPFDKDIIGEYDPHLIRYARMVYPTWRTAYERGHLNLKHLFARVRSDYEKRLNKI